MIDVIGWSLVIIGAVVDAIAIGWAVGESMRIRLPDYDEPPWMPPLTLPSAIDLDLDYSSAKTPIGIGKSHST